jgi:hypothetical protein
VSTTQDQRRWPNGLALIALIAFALIVPTIALFGMIFASSWLGTTASDLDRIEKFVWGVVATTSCAVALVSALVAAIFGGRMTRVLACVTVPLALFGLYFYGSNTIIASHELPTAMIARTAAD